MGWMLLALVGALTIIGWVRGRFLLAEWRAFQAWREAGSPEPVEAVATSALPAVDLTPLRGAGRALTKPPNDLRQVAGWLERKGDTRYRFPIGWMLDGAGAPFLVNAGLVGDVNHTLISGQSDVGKDNLALSIMFTLARFQAPQRVQFCVIDGKGLDFAGWARKAHTWRLALDPDAIAPTMAALTAERKRRGQILQAAEVAKWDEYQGVDLPLLVVYVSELSLLEDAVGKTELTAWLNSELAAGRAFGMRYIIATQTASNFATRWRSQLSLYLAGFQPSQSQDEPNTGLTSKEVRERGGVPPSELPAPPTGAGVFTAIQGGAVYTVRTSYIDTAQRRHLLGQLPEKSLQQTTPRPTVATHDTTLLELLRSGAPLPIADEKRAIAQQSVVEAVEFGYSADQKSSVIDTLVALPVAVSVVPAVEQRRILQAAQTERSRRGVCHKLYEVTGGVKYDWVRITLDAAGLLT